MKEPEPFFRGMLVETGYALETIPYARPRRSRGLSNNNFFTLLDFALSGLATSSKKLLRLPFFVGVLAGGVALVSAIIGLVALATGGSGAGWLIGAALELQFALIRSEERRVGKECVSTC